MNMSFQIGATIVIQVSRFYKSEFRPIKIFNILYKFIQD